MSKACIDSANDNDLLRVGPNKPLGHLSVSTLKRYGWSVPKIVCTLKHRGLATLVLSPAQCCVASGAVYAYHRAALSRVLLKNEKVLKKEGWPLGPDGFVLYHFLKYAAPGTDLFDVIADAYDDIKNKLRKSNGFVVGSDNMPRRHCWSYNASLTDSATLQWLDTLDVCQ
jgi:hypothetical protein